MQHAWLINYDCRRRYTNELRWVSVEQRTVASCEEVKELEWF